MSKQQHRQTDAQTPEPIDWAGRLERTLHVEHDGDSHTEPDAMTFHPSQLARCKRQATISKFGLEEHDTKTLGIFYTGTLIHEWLEDEMDGRLPAVAHEKEIRNEYVTDSGAVVVTGHADVVDEHNGVVYDFKTRGGWYNFDPPTDRHLDQLTLYMDAVGAEAGQVVYINKKDLEVRTWPEGDTFAFDPDRRDQLVEKAREIRDAVKDAAPIESVDDVPFEPCGCWLCGQESE